VNIVNQQQREELDIIQKIAIDDLEDMHQLQRTAVEAMAEVKIMISEEQSQLKQELYELEYKLHWDALQQRHNMDKTEYQMDIEFERAAVRQMHQFQNAQQEAQSRLQNEQAETMFHHEFNNQAATYLQAKKAALDHELKNVKEKNQNLPKSDLKKLLAATKAKFDKDQEPADLKFSKAQEKRRKGHMDALSKAAQAAQNRIKQRQFKEYQILDKKFDTRKKEMGPKHDRERRDFELRWLGEKRRIENENTYSILTIQLFT
jgi:hypothetical protein